MQTGWIKLHRSIRDWEWYSDANTCRLFIHLLLKANHDDNEWKGIPIKSGELITGRKVLSQELCLTEQQIRTSIKRLKSTNEITIKTTNKYSLIQINNWTSYQQDNQLANKPITNKQPTTNHKQECKEYKNDKNIYSKKTFKDGSTIQLEDGTTAVRRFGEWVDASSHAKLDRNYYKQLP